MEKFNTKMAENADVGFKLRIWHKKGAGKQSARYLIKCGDCDRKLEIYYGDDEFLEINGVNASKKEWSEMLLPLLK